MTECGESVVVPAEDPWLATIVRCSGGANHDGLHGATVTGTRTFVADGEPERVQIQVVW